MKRERRDRQIKEFCEECDERGFTTVNDDDKHITLCMRHYRRFSEMHTDPPQFSYIVAFASDDKLQQVINDRTDHEYRLHTILPSKEWEDGKEFQGYKLIFERQIRAISIV